MMDKMKDKIKDMDGPQAAPAPGPGPTPGTQNPLQRPSMNPGAPPAASVQGQSLFGGLKGDGKSGETFSKMKQALGTFGKDLMDKGGDLVRSGSVANEILSSGNLYGMRERAVAAETIEAMCAELSR